MDEFKIFSGMKDLPREVERVPVAETPRCKCGRPAFKVSGNPGEWICMSCWIDTRTEVMDGGN